MTEKEALTLIEKITGDLRWDSDKELLIRTIFRVAHTTLGKCEYKMDHTNWKEEAQKVYEKVTQVPKKSC